MRPIVTQPGYSEADVEAILATRQHVYADCYTLAPRHGDPVYLTTRDRSVTVDVSGSPRTYKADGLLGIDGIKLSLQVGISVDEQEIQLYYSPTATLVGYPARSAIRLGRLDGGRITRERYYSSGPGQPWVGSILLFFGRIGHADKISKNSCSLTVKSELVILSSKLPRDLYQPGCNHVLYDTGCGLDRESFKVSATTQSGTTASTIVSSSAVSALELGAVYIDNPEGITLVRTITEIDGSNIHLSYPLDFLPADGTAFDAYQGCDRTRARCVVLGNEARYKGYPYVPVAETAI